jgi:hypothetical protein
VCGFGGLIFLLILIAVVLQTPSYHLYRSTGRKSNALFSQSKVNVGQQVLTMIQRVSPLLLQPSRVRAQTPVGDQTSESDLNVCACRDTFQKRQA